MAGLGLLIAALGAAGTLLNLTDLVPAFGRLPIPAATWPIAAVAGFVLYTFTRRSGD